MPASELADQDIKSKREKINTWEFEARRLDWLSENRKKIQETLGIDPNNSWEYEENIDDHSEPDTDPPDI